MDQVVLDLEKVAQTKSESFRIEYLQRNLVKVVNTKEQDYFYDPS